VPKFAGFAPESFTHVLLDAPCTALGLRPKLQQPLTLKELLETAAYQRQLLAAAVRLVQPGGFLVYSTCSVSPGELSGPSGAENTWR
jgi:16S rRNA C967 or C1407 C5-methylase (RsmB/RsmF family)